MARDWPYTLPTQDLLETVPGKGVRRRAFATANKRLPLIYRHHNPRGVAPVYFVVDHSLGPSTPATLGGGGLPLISASRSAGGWGGSPLHKTSQETNSSPRPPIELQGTLHGEPHVGSLEWASTQNPGSACSSADLHMSPTV